MKKTLTLIACLCYWMAVSQAQDFSGDYVILKSGEKVTGEILRNFDRSDFKSITFRSAGETVVFEPADLSAFGLSNQTIFRSKNLPANEGLEFLQHVFSGEIGLYYFKGRYFIEKEGGLVELKAYYAETEIEGYTTRKYVKEYISTLKINLHGQCGVSLFQRIEELDFEETDFIGLLSSYHKCIDKPFTINKEKISLFSLSPLVSVGISTASLDKGKSPIDWNQSLRSGFGYRIQAGLRLHDFKFVPRLFLDMRVGWIHYSDLMNIEILAFDRSITGSEEFTESTFQIPIHLNYSIYKTNQMEAYAGIGGGIWKSKGQSNFAIVDEYNELTDIYQLHEVGFLSWKQRQFVPSIKAGASRKVGENIRVFSEISMEWMPNFYKLNVLDRRIQYSKSLVSFTLGLSR